MSKEVNSFDYSPQVNLPVRETFTPRKALGCALLALAGFGGLVVGVIGFVRLRNMHGWWSVRAFTHLSQTHTIIMMVTGGVGGTLLLGGTAAVLLRNAPLDPDFNGTHYCRGACSGVESSNNRDWADCNGRWGFGYNVHGDRDLSQAMSQFKQAYQQGLDNKKFSTQRELQRFFQPQMDLLSMLIGVQAFSFVQIVPLEDRFLLLVAHKGNSEVIVEMEDGTIWLAYGYNLNNFESIAIDITGAKRVIGYSSQCSLNPREVVESLNKAETPFAGIKACVRTAISESRKELSSDNIGLFVLGITTPLISSAQIIS